MITECEAVGGMRIRRGILGENPSPLPLCQRQIPYDLKYLGGFEYILIALLNYEF
jgi:hypothetical protein